MRCISTILTAEGLTSALVQNYVEMERKMEEGTVNRTIASTNMNATSSRAHTIVGIKFTQKFKNAANVETAKTAIINLVDLAGRYEKKMSKKKVKEKQKMFVCLINRLLIEWKFL